MCQLDRFANGVKPTEIQRFLGARGHDVHLVNTYYLSRASSVSGLFLNRLPRPGLKSSALYAAEVASALLTHRWAFGRRCLSYYPLLAQYRLRRSILASSLPLDAFDLIICEIPHDAGVLTTSTCAATLYDCPTPWADELYFEGRLTHRQHEKLRRIETDLFERVTHLAFWWESYARYALEHYGISGRNLMTLNFGCTPRATRAEFSTPPRVVYLGSLSSRFIDLPLLSRLAKLYPHIDVYGAPPPDSSLGLHYLGYAPPAVLQRYQLGLITCTKDDLLNTFEWTRSVAAQRTLSRVSSSAKATRIGLAPGSRLPEPRRSPFCCAGTPVFRGKPTPSRRYRPIPLGSR